MSDHDDNCERWTDGQNGFFLCHCARRKRLAAGLTEVPSDCLEFPPPYCPHCEATLWHDGDGWRCDFCNLSWDSDGTGGQFTDTYADSDAALLAQRERWLEKWRARNDPNSSSVVMTP